MTSQKLTEALLLQAERDFQTASDLYKKDNYTYALFFGQLAIEKIIKALIVKKKNQIYPPIHSLRKLSNLAGLELNLNQKKDFDEITKFNIEARYDDVKFSFYKRADKIYTSIWFIKIKKYKIWLENQF